MTVQSKTHVLVVDDDPKIRTLLRRCFEPEGYRVTEAKDAGEARAKLDAGRYDLLTLDLGLPGTDGLTLAREIRQRFDVPIIMVTGKDEAIDRIVGLEVGADDYIAKPFHVRELLARVRAVLRRTSKAPGDPASHPTAEAPPAPRYAFDGWRLDIGRRELVDRSGRPCELTTAEFNLLEVFVRHAGRVLSRDALMDLLKGRDWSPLDRSIDTQIARLRKKIEAEPDEPQLIKTVRGVGYVFAVPVSAV